MGVYVRGNGLTIVERFYDIDPLTHVATLADPTTVVFTVEDPDGNTVAYVSGVDLNITNPSVGVWLCLLPPPLPTGTYSYVVEGTGALVATGAGTFTLTETGVLAADLPTVAEYGPSQPWITASDLINANCGATVGDPKVDSAASIGSTLVWDLSGRKFSGVSERTVRPCRQGCRCFVGVLPTGWSGYGFGPWWFDGSGGGWYNECGDRCGCQSKGSTVVLAGYPVREILDVKIDGVALDPDTYRLDRRRELVRLAAGSPLAQQFWPACQDMTLPEDAPGTFAVHYSWGQSPPELGKQAAIQVACEFFKALSGDASCKLPARATKVTRQGITVERIASFAQMWRKGATGLALLDAFIAEVNPTGTRRRAAVMSPDLPGFGLRTGQ